jgi:16S rRNA (guanine527-N7)-methyltransferase
VRRFVRPAWQALRVDRSRARPATAGTDLHGELEALLERYAAPPDATTPLGLLLDALAASAAPTSVHEPAEGMQVHIADSLAGLEVEELRDAGVIADLGAGAGLPGLVLATMLPRTRVFLVESARRKCDFLRSTAAAMGVTNVDVVWRRAEEWGEGIGRCDAVCARALASLAVVCEYAAPLLREGGVLVAWKGAIDEAEADGAAAAADYLGLELQPARPVIPFPGSERRTLYVARKVAPTPPGIPRRPGIATKRPLSARKPR